MKTMIVAEKPSLAREIISMLEGEENETFQKNDGYYESENYYVSWFFGHLLHAKKPDEIDERFKRWSVENLPILHDLEYSYTEGEKGTANQGALLVKLSKLSERIVNACDPDREGEGIFRIWQTFENIDNPVYRLWSPSLAHADLAKAWRSIKPGSDYDFLGSAQAMRSYSDYIVGMNGTRAYTCKAGELLPIGRVKTATLALVVKRDEEVENFVKSFSYKLVGNWQGLPFELIDGPEDKESLQKICGNIGTEAFSSSSIKKERKLKNPPKPFSMPDLQAEANKLFGYDLDVTLAIAQSLYEKKLITYPRTDSPYLPKADIIKYTGLFDMCATDQEKTLFNPSIPAFIKDTDAPHTAIIITDVPAPAGLDEKHLAIYDLIKSRFITSFLAPLVYDEIRAEISGPSGHTFRSIFRNTIEAGFTNLHKEDDEEESLNSSIDPQDLEIACGPIRELKVKEIEKKKPSYFTPATLLKAMINVSKNIEDKELKEVLRDVEGLGTAATRDTYPKDLEHDGFVYRKSKFIISTPKGRSLIHIVHPKLRDPIYTAEFESDLRKIERGEKAVQLYKTAIQSFVKEIIDIPDIKNEFVDEAFKCPKCGNSIKAFAWGWACSSGKDQCGFAVSKKICEKEISETVVKELLKYGHTKNAVKGFWSKKTSKQFAAWLKLSEDFKVDLTFDPPDAADLPVCPKCGQPLKEFDWGWACSAGKEKCGFSVSKVIAGKKLTVPIIKELLKNKSTKEIRGFKAKSGKDFSASLALDENLKVIFSFNK